MQCVKTKRVVWIDFIVMCTGPFLILDNKMNSVKRLSSGTTFSSVRTQKELQCTFTSYDDSGVVKDATSFTVRLRFTTFSL